MSTEIQYTLEYIHVRAHLTMDVVPFHYLNAPNMQKRVSRFRCFESSRFHLNEIK